MSRPQAKPPRRKRRARVDTLPIQGDPRLLVICDTDQVADEAAELCRLGELSAVLHIGGTDQQPWARYMVSPTPIETHAERMAEFEQTLHRSALRAGYLMGPLMTLVPRGEA